MKKITIFLILAFILFTLNVFSQKVNTQTVIGSGSANGGEYTYEATIRTKIGASGSYFDIGIYNYKITSFKYKGEEAHRFNDANFPIEIKNIQSAISGSYSIYYSGNGILVSFESFSISGVQQGDFITRVELKDDNLKSVKDYLKDNKSKIQNISINLYNINLKNDYFDQLSTIRDLMDKKLKTNDEIDNLKDQIRALDSDKKEDIIKEIALNKKLQSIDVENTNKYSSEISVLEDRLQSIEEKEKAEQEKQNTKNNSSSTKTGLTLKKDSDSEKDNNDEKEVNKKTTEIKITKGPCQYLEDYRAQLRTAQYQGQVENIKKQIAKLEVDCERAKANAFPVNNAYSGYNNSQQKIQQVDQQYDNLENNVHQGIKSLFSETINKYNKQEEELTRKIESGELQTRIMTEADNLLSEQAEKSKQHELKGDAWGDYKTAETNFISELNLRQARKGSNYRNLIEPKANAKYVYMTVFSFDGRINTYDQDGYNRGQFSYSQPIQLPLDKVDPEIFVNFLLENNYLEEYKFRGSQSSVLFGHSQNEVENKIARIIPKYQKYILIKRKQINLSYTNLATYYNSYLSSNNSEARDIKNKLYFFDKLKDGVFYKRVNDKGFGLFVKYGTAYVDLDIPDLESFKSIININNETALIKLGGNVSQVKKFKIGKEDVFVREQQEYRPDSKKKFYTIDVFGNGYYGFKKGLYKSSLYNYYTAYGTDLDYKTYDNIRGSRTQFSTGLIKFIYRNDGKIFEDSGINLVGKELNERHIGTTSFYYRIPFESYLGAATNSKIDFFPVRKITLDRYENAIKGSNKEIGKLMFVKVKQVEDLGYKLNSYHITYNEAIKLNSDVIDVDHSIDYKLSKEEFDKTYNFLYKEQKNEVLDKEILNYFIEAAKQYHLLD